MASLTQLSLAESIFRVCPIEPATFKAVAGEVESATIPYQLDNADYHTGGCYKASLLSSSQELPPNRIRRGSMQLTALADQLPLTTRFILDLGLHIHSVCIARNDPHTYTWEHRDFDPRYTDSRMKRLHIPLNINEDAHFYFQAAAVHMRRGWIWMLDQTTGNAFANRGDTPQVHIVIDCHDSPSLVELLSHGSPEYDDVYPLQPLDLDKRKRLLSHAESVFISKGRNAAERSLLKSFFNYDLGTETSYDLLVDLYRQLGFASREHYWIAEMRSRMYLRDTRMAGPVRQEITNLGAIDSDLPQYQILEDVVDTCKQHSGLEEAYLGGSLAWGEYDGLSSIDLFCMVSPDEFVDFVQSVDQDIQAEHSALSAGWVDGSDLDGIKLVYILETDGGVFQLNLYVSCKGTLLPSKLGDVDVENRLFWRPRYAERNDYLDELAFRLYEKDIKTFLSDMTMRLPRPAKAVTEMCVLVMSINKHICRGHLFLARDEFQKWKKAFIKLMRLKLDVRHLDDGFRRVREMASAAEDVGLYDDLCLVDQYPLTRRHLGLIHNYSLGVFALYFPKDDNECRRLTRRHRQRCDEGKPACRRCVRNGRECEYPVVKLQFVMHKVRPDGPSGKHSPGKDSPVEDGAHSPRSVTSAVPSLPRPPQSDNPDMISSFQYYLERAITTFKSTPSAFELDLWHTEGATRLRNATPVMVYFMGAFSSLHQACWNREPSPLATSTFYFDNVGKGLQMLIDNMSSSNTDHQTMTFYGCHILRIMESWRTGNVSTSRAHIMGMKTLLTELESRPSATRAMPFIQMVKMYTEEHIKLIDACMSSVAEARQFAVPFSDLNVAIKSLHSLFVFWLLPMMCMNQFSWVAPPDRKLVTNLSEIWRTSFEGFLANALPADRNGHIEQMLWLHWTIATVCLMLPRGVPAPAELDDQFQSIATQIQTFSPETIQVSHVQAELFSTIPAALFVFLHCRNPRVRHATIAHLLQHEQSEGVWNSRIALHVAQATFVMERRIRMELCPRLDVLVMPERAYCEIAKDRSSASINFTFCVQGKDGPPKFRSERVTLTSPQDVEACMQTSWPLEAVLRTFGYLSDNSFSSAAIMTPQILRDGALMRRKLESATAPASNNLPNG